MNLCECGCGREVVGRFVRGHNNKDHNPMLGKRQTDKQKQAVSIANKGKPSGMKGHFHTEETKKLYSLTRSKENNPMFGKRHREESIKKMSEKKCGNMNGKDNPMFGRKHTNESKKIIGEKSKLYHNKIEVKEETSRMFKNFWSRLSDLEKEKFFSKLFKSCETKPNKLEILLNNIIEGVTPSEFKYVGDGQVWIGGKNPDWINVNGKKQVIELFGDYWHKIEDEEIRKSHFKQYGFDCLVIWEAEFKDTEQLKIKVKNYSLN